MEGEISIPQAASPGLAPDQPNLLGHCLSSSPQDLNDCLSSTSYSPRKTLESFCQSPDHTVVRLSSGEPGAATLITQGTQGCC